MPPPKRSIATPAIIRPHRRLVTNRVVWSVCWSVAVVSPAKTAEAIEVPFGLWAQVGPRNHVLNRGPDPLREGAILRGGGLSVVKYRDALPGAVQK